MNIKTIFATFFSLAAALTLTSGVVLASVSAAQSAPVGIAAAADDMPLDDQSKPDPQSYHVYAEGTHTCQSTSSLGHTCTVTGWFPGCTTAKIMLTGRSCCSGTAAGGHSIDFKLTRCP